MKVSFKKTAALAAGCVLLLSSTSFAANYYDDGTMRTEIHQSTGGHHEPAQPDKDGPRVSGTLWVHLYGFEPNTVVRTKIEYRGDHPTNPYDKVAGPWHMVVGEDGSVRGPNFNLPAGKYKVKTQINYGQPDEAKDYRTFVVTEGTLPSNGCGN